MTKYLRGIAVVAALLALAGCSGASGSAARDPMGGVTAPASGEGGKDSVTGPEAAPSAGSGTLAPQITRSAQVSVKVTDVGAAAAKLRQIAAEQGGQVITESLVIAVGEQNDSYLVLSVDAAKLDSTLAALEGVGPIVSRVVTSDDVTTQVADVNARVDALNASIERLMELSKKAGSVSDLTEVEAELSSRIAERDSMVAQQKVLAGLVAQSRIQVRLLTPAQASEIQTTGFLGGLSVGWNALVATGQTLLTVVGALLPFLAVLALLMVPLVLWRRRHAKRRLSGMGSQPVSTPTVGVAGPMGQHAPTVPPSQPGLHAGPEGPSQNHS